MMTKTLAVVAIVGAILIAGTTAAEAGYHDFMNTDDMKMYRVEWLDNEINWETAKPFCKTKYGDLEGIGLANINANNKVAIFKFYKASKSITDKDRFWVTGDDGVSCFTASFIEGTGIKIEPLQNENPPCKGLFKGLICQAD